MKTNKLENLIAIVTISAPIVAYFLAQHVNTNFIYLLPLSIIGLATLASLRSRP